MKKILSALICLCMIVALFPAMIAKAAAEPSVVAFGYAYDVSRFPSFPNGEGDDVDLSGFSAPLKRDENNYLSSEGEWTLTKVGTYSEADSAVNSVAPDRDDAILDNIVDVIANEYGLNATEKNALSIYKLTDESDALVAYGVAIRTDATNDKVLFIGDIWTASGAGYLLSTTEISGTNTTFTAGQLGLAPITYNQYNILTDDTNDELSEIQTVLSGIADVTQDGEVINIKLTSNVCGRLHFGHNNFFGPAPTGTFVLDMNGKTIDPGDKEEALCLDNRFAGTITVTGEGTFKKGANNIIYNGGGTLKFKKADGKDWYRLVKNGTTDIFDVKTTDEREFHGTYTSFDETITLTQGVFATYTITFDANGGTVSPTSDVTVAEKLSSLPTPTLADHTFNGWFTAISGGTEVTTSTVFSEDTTIYAQWTYNAPAPAPTSSSGSRKYIVKFETNGGSKLAAKRVSKNSNFAKPADPVKDGFEFDGWYTDKELTKVYDFSKKITSNVTIYAKWVAVEAEKEPEAENATTHDCVSEAFEDLDATKWYHEDVDYVLENKIMLGTEETKFAPDGSLTRAMLVTILYRNEGEPATNRSIPFADIDMGAYYANAVVWAQQNGIVNGISETEFAPDNNVTREQLTTIMLRYAQLKGMDAVTMEENLHFADSDDISEYAVFAMNWGVGQNYIFSRTEGKISPKDAATRAEVAAFIHRFMENK